MIRLLTDLAESFAERTILRYMQDGQVRELGGEAFFRDVDRCAAVLERLGLRGKHIGIMGANRVQWLVFFCGIYRAGGIAVLLSPDLDRQELWERIAQADVAAVAFDAALTPVIPEGTEAICMDAPLPEGDPGPLPAPDPEALACILFTSGTTAAAKAVMLSHRAMVAGICHDVIPCPFNAQLAILPMHHVAGFASVLNTWYLGRVVCLGEDMRYVSRYLREMKPDYTLTVPSLLQAIVRRLGKGGRYGEALGWDLHLIGCGGARFQPEVIASLHARGIRVLQSYGATEAGGLGFDWEMDPERPDTIGKPPRQIQVQIRDGELFLRSDSVMMGYYKEPEATDEVLVDGWYATGDLCERDSEGYLYLRGRKKNLIILSNGENVSPEQIETRLSACPQIGEMMVGVEGELIAATVYPVEDGPVAREEIAAAVEAYNRSVPTYKRIQILHFTDRPFAKTQIGKLIRGSVTGGSV